MGGGRPKARPQKWYLTLKEPIWHWQKEGEGVSSRRLQRRQVRAYGGRKGTKGAVPART